MAVVMEGTRPLLAEIQGLVGEESAAVAGELTTDYPFTPFLLYPLPTPLSPLPTYYPFTPFTHFASIYPFTPLLLTHFLPLPTPPLPIPLLTSHLPTTPPPFLYPPLFV